MSGCIHCGDHDSEHLTSKERLLALAAEWEKLIAVAYNDYSLGHRRGLEVAALELYWLIEAGPGEFSRFDDNRHAQYLEKEHYGSVDWTSDPHKAQKFLSEDDAQRFVAATILRVYDLRICEHMFNCGTTEAAPADEGKV